MSNETKLTPESLDRTAELHRGTADSVNTQKKKLEDAINAMIAANNGQAMEALRRVHIQLDADCNDVIKTLRLMADDVTGFAKQMRETDAANAGLFK